MQKQMKMKSKTNLRILIWFLCAIVQRIFAVAYLFMSIYAAKSIDCANIILVSIPVVMFLVLTPHNLLWEETQIKNCFQKPKRNRKPISKKKLAIICGIIALIVFWIIVP